MLKGVKRTKTYDHNQRTKEEFHYQIFLKCYNSHKKYYSQPKNLIIAQEHHHQSAIYS